MRVVAFNRVLTALALMTSLAPPAHAERERGSRDQAQGQTYAAETTLPQRRVALQRAIELVQRATGGRILEAKEFGNQDRIKVLIGNGEVRIVYVDATTGAMR
jgi:hypothetical protein